MPRPSKGLTSEIKLRMTDTERAAVETLVGQYAEYGVRISLNDAARLMIMRASRNSPCSAEEARSQLWRHYDTCEWCDTTGGPKCPDGQQLKACASAFARLDVPTLPGAEQYAEGLARALPGAPASRRIPGLPGAGI